MNKLIHNSQVNDLVEILKSVNLDNVIKKDSKNDDENSLFELIRVYEALAMLRVDDDKVFRNFIKFIHKTDINKRISSNLKLEVLKFYIKT